MQAAHRRPTGQVRLYIVNNESLLKVWLGKEKAFNL